MVNKRAVVYLVDDDIYMDIIITQWSAANGRGGMMYKRVTVVSTLI